MKLEKIKNEITLWDNLSLTDCIEAVVEVNPQAINLTEEEILDEAIDLNMAIRDDVVYELKEAIPGLVLLVADYGLWNGREVRYMVGDMDYITEQIEYCDCDNEVIALTESLDLQVRRYHHDGRNVHTIYRVVNPIVLKQMLKGCCAVRNKLYDPDEYGVRVEDLLSAGCVEHIGKAELSVSIGGTPVEEIV